MQKKEYGKLKKNNFCVVSRYKKYKYFALRKLFLYSSKISFLKKFIMCSLYLKKNMFQTISICRVSGKSRSCLHRISLKRHTFKKIITQNFIPNMVKKNK